MTTRKRGQPDTRRKPARKKKKRGVAARCLRIAGALIARHPSVAGGSAAFVVIFSFVAANAIWYQPEGHPAPFFATRAMPSGAAAKMVRHSAMLESRKPTVDQILAGLANANAADAAMTGPRVAGDSTASIPAAAPDADPTLVAIQKGLAAHQFYSGPYDGRLNVATRAAIEAFQAAKGEPLTGEPSPQLLTEIEATTRNAVAIPRSRPAPAQVQAQTQTSTPTGPQPSGDPIGRLVAGTQPVAASTGGGVAQKAPSSLVSRIQTGLRNIAYSNVAIDGIAGAQTKAAIRNFEKNYRLPETGEPNKRVLDKLVAIGAL